MTGNIEYLYEDEDICVCHKPAGMATEGAGVGQMDLVSAVRNYLSRKNKNDKTGRQRNLPPYVATVNRLDKPVEGVILLAKNKKAASDIASQIKQRTTAKYYYALCYGKPDENSGKLKDILIRRKDTLLADTISESEMATLKDGSVTLLSGEKVELIGGEAKNAELEYEVLSTDDNTALLKIHLITGRFHQIRVQLSKMGIPILGDDKYGSRESLEYSKSRGINTLCLVSYSFSFRHPSTKKRMTFEITPDNENIRALL